MPEPGETLLVVPGGREPPEIDGGEEAVVTDPSKVVRLAAMAQVLLQEANRIELDEGARQRLSDIHDRSVEALGELLSAELCAEMRRLGLRELPHDELPSTSELRIAQAQLVGWLDGLFQGIRAMLTTQHLVQQEELAQLYAESLRSAREREDERRRGSYM